MVGGTLSHTVTSGITLDSVAYPSPLTITTAGAVDTGAEEGAVALVATLSAGYVLNQGSMTGGVGVGGLGVDLGASTLVNDGRIAGGYGAAGEVYGVVYRYSSDGGVGGTAVDLAGGSLVNEALIVGGSGGAGLPFNPGGYPASSGGAGSDAVDVMSGSVMNSGTIRGGGAGFSGTTTLAAAGVGVDLNSGSVTNLGLITGGEGASSGASSAGAGAIGVSLAGGSLSNSGRIIGGQGGLNGSYGRATAGGAGGSGVALQEGSLTNNGTVIGGAGGGDLGPGGVGGAGGVGVDMAAGTLTNQGLIAGGAGAFGSYRYGPQGAGFGGLGATGLLLQGGGATNTGTIFGGNGGGTALYSYGGGGGSGVILAATSAVLTNDGLIVGGNAGYLYYYGGAPMGRGGGISGRGLLIEGGSLANGGTISGGSGGLGVYVMDGNVANDGLITGGIGINGTVNGGLYNGPNYPGGAGGTGIVVAGGAVTNAGTIAGGLGGDSTGQGGRGGTGAYIDSNVTNTGLIVGGDGHAGDGGRNGGNGAVMSVGTFTNAGTVAGGKGGDGAGAGGAGVGGTGGAGIYSFNFSGDLINTGTIMGGDAGNASPGFSTVAGGAGVAFHSGGTLTDGGFIGGGAGGTVTADAINFGNGAARLILDPGANFAGAVVASTLFQNVLELADPAAAGTITGLGDTIIGFGTIAFDPGATWLAAGGAAGIAAGQTIDGFHIGDTIELTGFVETGFTYVSDGLVLSGAGGTSETLGIQGSFTTTDFNVFSIGGNSIAELRPACFAAGTRIATDRGEVAVEALVVGDLVRVLLGGPPAPIIWIGRRFVDCTRHPKPTQVWPVRIRAGAFGPGQPRRDLFLSPDHALFVNEVLIPVRYLLSGKGIAQVPVDTVTYYHLELPEHDILLAENLPAESYLGVGDHAEFANGGAMFQQFRDFVPRMWDALGCAKLIVTGPELVAARRLIAARGARPAIGPQRQVSVIVPIGRATSIAGP
jgi:hypothetical protein